MPKNISDGNFFILGLTQSESFGIYRLIFTRLGCFMKKIISAALALGLLSSSVLAGNFAATVTDFSGKVLVNRGAGFVPATGSITLRAGDKVMVGDNSFAVVSYAECAVSLSTPGVVTVSETAPCAAEGAATIQPVADIDPGYSAPIFPIWPLVIIGGGIAGTCAIACGDIFGNNENPGTGALPPA
jgi:hypothetical protein